MNLRVVFFLITSLTFYTTEAQITSVYVSPHGDDWQLFMNPNAYNSIKNNREKVIFLQTTAADAATGPDGEHPFYLAREEGTLRAIRFMSNTFGSGANLGAEMNKTVVNVNGHDIFRASYRNTVSYFLRVPDGNMDGSGYPMYNYECIEKLFNGDVEQMSAIDNSTSYSSIEDYKQTIKAIIENEAEDNDHLVFHIADTDSEINPGDHSDHLYSSKILQDIAPEFKGVTLNLYTEYHSAGFEQNVFEHDYMVSVGAWAVTASGLSDFYHNSTWNDGHNQWLGRQYFRTEDIGDLPPTNIALNKPTSSSNYEEGHRSSDAVDNNYKNWWGGVPYAQWWRVNLEDIYAISEIVVTNYYDGNRYYQYDIEASVDGLAWTKIVDFNDNTTPSTANGNQFEMDNVEAQYLRVNMNYNSANPGVHIIEFEVYGVLKSTITSSSNTNLIGMNKGKKNQENFEVILYPNPIKKGNSINLSINVDKTEGAIVEVSNLTGQLLYKQHLELLQGANLLKLPTDNFIGGINNINVRYSNSIKTFKLIVVD